MSKPEATLSAIVARATLGTTLPLALLTLGIFTPLFQSLTAQSCPIYQGSTDAIAQRGALPAQSCPIDLDLISANIARQLVPSSCSLELGASDARVLVTLVAQPCPLDLSITSATIATGLALSTQSCALGLESSDASLVTLLTPASAPLDLGATNASLIRLLTPIAGDGLQLQASDTGSFSNPAIIGAESAEWTLDATNAAISVSNPALLNAQSAEISLEGTDALPRRLIPAALDVNLDLAVTAATIQIGTPLGALTTDYISRVNAAGGSVSTSAASLLDQVLYGTYSDGASGSGRIADFISAFHLLWLPFQSGLAGLEVNVVRTITQTNSAFVSADWSLKDGLQCGKGKFLNTNFNTSSITNSNSTGLGYVAKNTWQAPIGVVGIAIGQAQSNGFDLGTTTTTGQFRHRVWTSGTLNRNIAATTVLQSYRVSSTSIESYANDVYNQSTIANVSPGNRNVYIGARNTNGTADLHYNGILQGAWITSRALTQAEAQIMNNAMQHMRANRPGI